MARILVLKFDLMNEETFKMPDLFIASSGEWFSDGQKVIHERIYKLFNLSLHKNGGQGYYIRIGEQTCPVRVENTPFVVRGAYYENDEEGRDVIWLTLNDGRRVPLEPGSLRAHSEVDLRCSVLDGEFEAAFSAAALAHMAPFLERDSENGGFSICLNGCKYCL